MGFNKKDSEQKKVFRFLVIKNITCCFIAVTEFIKPITIQSVS